MTQWGEQKFKAAEKYLQKTTPTSRHMMRIASITGAGGKINWINDLVAAFVIDIGPTRCLAKSGANMFSTDIMYRGNFRRGRVRTVLELPRALGWAYA